jgi:signal transduction histidine kinase
MSARPARRWQQRPRASVRLRLTLTYSALFVVSGAALLGVSYLLVSRREHSSGTAASIVCSITGRSSAVPANQPVQIPSIPVSSGKTCLSLVKAAGGGSVSGSSSGSAAAQGNLPPGLLPPGVVQRSEQLRQAVADSQDHTLRSLLIESLVALGILAVASLGLGWWIAGRVLRPVHRITDAARRLSEQTLHERIDLPGPNDELKELADTFDAMLGRLDRAFTSQRRFVANASHELRTPLATERVLIDEALANRGASPEELRAILEQLRVNSEETEGIIGALLLLARSERGIDQWSRVDLADVAGCVVARAMAEAVTCGVELQSDLLAAAVAGDPSLLERLAGNLVENGIRHNVAGGWVRVTTTTEAGWGVLHVSNSGRVLDPESVAGLVEPFRRSGPDRSSTVGGFGLGLSIVDAIVQAHGGRLLLAARPDGGLEVRVALRWVRAFAPTARSAGQVVGRSA